MTSAATRIPPELYDNILSHVGPYEILSTTGRSRERREAKQLLSACSLTCFYWATQCRRRIFRFLALRSFEDIRTLRTFMLSPPPRFPRILAQVRFLTAEWEIGRGHPWLHNLYSFVQSHNITLENTSDRGDNHAMFLTLHVLGPLPPLPADPRGRRDVIRRILSRGLPRTIPAHFRRCNSLVLENIQFNDLSDFIALLQGLSFVPDHLQHSTHLRLKNVRLTGSNAPDASFALFSPWPVRASIDKETCSDPGSFTQLASYLGRPSWARDLYLSDVDNQVILTIAANLIDKSPPRDMDAQALLRLVRAGFDGSPTRPAAQLFIDMVDGSARYGDLRGHDRLSPKFCIESKAIDPEYNEYRISRVSVAVAALGATNAENFEACCMVYDWVAIGEALLRLRRPVSVNFDFRQHTHITRFFQGHREQDVFRRLEATLTVHLYDDKAAHWNMIEDLSPLLHPPA